MTADANCIFCQIARGSSPCHKVFEDELVVAFMDIYPATEGHTLVLPKTHHPSVLEITDDSVRAVASAARSVAQAIDRTISPDGVSIVQANAAAAGQTVMHYHVHVLPRLAGQKLRLHGPRQGDPAQLERVARSIAANL